MKIGVFDSGVGGLSVANAIQKALPDHNIIFKNDAANVPYGTKTPEQLLKLVSPIFEELINEGCQIIVVACNTVSTTIITQLRALANVPMIAIEPMLKPAATLSKSGTIVVCATPTTLASPRYAELKANFASSINVIEPDCSDWALMIEDEQINEELIAQQITPGLGAGADVIVLACTHYHWIEEQICRLAADRAQVLQPETAIIAELTRVLARLG